MSLKTLIKEHPLVADAYTFAKHAHRGQTRKTGAPYINHIFDVAETIANLNLDEHTVIAALLHDIPEQTEYTIDQIRSRFGGDIAHLVEGVEWLGTIKYRGNTAQVETVRDAILAGVDDIRILIIKLADRLDNMKTVATLPREKQKRVAVETAEIYAPLAAQLGMQRIGSDLAELAFPITHPDEYRKLVDLIAEHYKKRTAYLKTITPLLQRELAQQSIHPLFIDYRAKHYYSLYKKLQTSDGDINKIYDLIAIRIIVASLEECYATLGTIHSLWPPLPGRIKDYIALPKQNGYRSLHTTVFSQSKKITEIQIRTLEMHEEAENGIAAHIIYKQPTSSQSTRSIRRANQQIIKQLRQWKENPRNTISFKIDFFKDRIFVNTPKGEIVDLPAGATPVDFAYQIHTEVGNTCRGARINDVLVPLAFCLRSGDTVEIITQKNKKPSISWLEFVRTPTAKQHIRARTKVKKTLR